jgi:alpha-maltose-1-phosphate synthase
MKIVYIIPYNWGGLPLYTAELANAVAEYEDVTVLASEGIDEKYFSEKVRLVKVLQPPSLNFGRPWKALSLKNVRSMLSFRKIRIVDELKPDIVHITTPLLPPLFFFLKLYGMDRKYKMAHTKHCLQSDSGPVVNAIENSLALLERFVRFDRIVVHTSRDRTMLGGRRRSITDRVRVIPQGVYSYFRKYPDGAPVEKNSVLFFGYVKEYKGLRYLFRAVPGIREKIPDVKMIVAGKGNVNGYLKELDGRYRDSLDVRNRYIPDEEVAQLFRSAEIIALPYSSMSGQSAVANVALSFGKPMVATDTGGFPEVVADGINGFIVPPKDEAALANAIVRILTDDPLKRKMGEGSREIAKELSWESVAKKSIGLYREMLADQCKA